MEKFCTENPFLTFCLVLVSIFAIDSITSNFMNMVMSFWTRPKARTPDPENNREE